MEERTCPYCGNQHRAGAAFCPNTGKALPPLEPRPEPVRTHCQNCQSPIEPNWRVCPNCGAALGGDPVVPAIPYPVQYPAQPQPQMSAQYPVPPVPPAPQRAGEYYPQPNQPRARKITKKTWLIGCSVGLLGGIGLLAVICIVSVLLLGLGENNRTARIIPGEDTQVLLSVSPTLMQLPSLVYADRLEKSLAIFGAVPGAQDLASMSQGDLFQDLDIDAQRDILPWIGNEVSLAVLSDTVYSRNDSGSQMVSHRAAPGQQYYGSPILLTAATRNVNASNSFLRKLYKELEKEGAEIRSYSYEDVDITEINDSDSGTYLSIATFRGMVLLSMDPRMIEVAIDTAGKPNQSLYQQEQFQDMLKRLPANRMGMMFMDTSSLWSDGGSYSSPYELAFDSVEAFGGSFSLESSGLRFDYLLKYDMDGLSDTEMQILRQTSSGNSMTSKLPGETIFYFSGQNLSLGFESAMKIWGSGEADFDEMNDEFRSNYHVDLRTDFLDHMQGEYSVVFLPVEGETYSSSIPAGMAIAIQLTNPEQVQESVETLLRNTADDSGDQYISNQVNGNLVQIVRSAYDSRVTLGAVVNGDILFISATEEMLNEMARSPKPSLADSQSFRNALRSLPSNERFYFVLDVDGTRDYFYNQMSEYSREDFRKSYDPYLKDLESLGFSVGKMDNAGIMHGQMRVNTR